MLNNMKLPKARLIVILNGVSGVLAIAKAETLAILVAVESRLVLSMKYLSQQSQSLINYLLLLSCNVIMIDAVVK